jgi:hypothetical protein
MLSTLIDSVAAYIPWVIQSIFYHFHDGGYVEEITSVTVTSVT